MPLHEPFWENWYHDIGKEIHRSKVVTISVVDEVAGGKHTAESSVMRHSIILWDINSAGFWAYHDVEHVVACCIFVRWAWSHCPWWGSVFLRFYIIPYDKKEKKTSSGVDFGAKIRIVSIIWLRSKTRVRKTFSKCPLRKGKDSLSTFGVSSLQCGLSTAASDRL